MGSSSLWQNFINSFDQTDSSKVLVVEQFVDEVLTDSLLWYGGYYDMGVRLVRLGDRGWNTLYTIEPAEEEWLALLHKYDYLYIANGDDYFIENYWENITDVPFINEGFYEISWNEDGTVLFDCINFELY